MTEPRVAYVRPWETIRREGETLKMYNDRLFAQAVVWRDEDVPREQGTLL